MLLGKAGQIVYEDFSVVDTVGDPVDGITLTEFTYNLKDETGGDSALTVSFTELGDGHYRASFTPDDAGTWYLIVYHSTYFPSGKAGTILIYEEDIDSLGALIQEIKDIEYGRWKILGTQMIFYKEDNVTEVARFDLVFNAENEPIERIKV